MSAEELRTAAKTGNVDEITRIAEIIAKQGADKINAADDQNGWTAMHFSAEKGDLECIKVLRKWGGDVNQADKKGRIPMHIAVQKGHSLNCILKQLVDLNSDINRVDQDGATAVFIAAREGHSQCIQALYGLGADVNKANNAGCTPLQIAQKNLHMGAIEAIKRLNMLS